ncbi:MAG: amidohydrolase family protein [Longimicrobiales bacterium]|nr:amidohydrolase family protein [Longimicrobiales bacterium]
MRDSRMSSVVRAPRIRGVPAERPRPPVRTGLTLTVLALVALGTPHAGPAQQPGSYDVVILGGRVVDPETGFDGPANVGIRGDRIAAVTGQSLEGLRVIDASGLVVAPGFIDPLTQMSAAQMPGARYKVTDGVTTVLGLHGGPVDVAGAYEAMAAEGALLNYGTNVGHGSLRAAVGLSSSDEEARAIPPTPAQVDEILELARRGIMEGALGIGFGLQYVPSTGEDEVFRLFQVAAGYGVPAHLHIRYLGPRRPANSVKAVQEVIATAAATGASAQIVHVNSTSPRDIELVLDLIEGAAARGVDVSADAYPWEAGSTALESSVFDEGFRERMSIDYGDIELVSNGERLTEETFRRYRNDDKRDGVIVHFIPTETLRKALTSPVVMVGSDGSINAQGRGHPRGAGTYARFLRQFVREWNELTLVEAMRKTSYLAALQLQQASPAFRRKGRLRVGADADIVVFDLDAIAERATYLEPARMSVGVRYVLVNGVPVVEDGAVVEDVRPGRPLRGAPGG